MPEFPHSLERSVVIRAPLETVFRFFTDSARWAIWWGAGSTIDAVPGGKVYIRHANGVEIRGEVLAVEPPQTIAFTYGDASQVTITLEPADGGTRLHLRHDFAESAARDVHVQGWRFQLSLFANVVANENFSGAQATVDSWFDAWVIADGPERDSLLARIVTPGIRFRDRYSLLNGVADVSAHITAAQRFMPGIALRRNGNVRQCQGTVLADWVAAGPDGVTRSSGASVFEFHPDGRIDSVTGLTNT